MTRIVQRMCNEKDNFYYIVRQWFHQTCTEYGYYQTSSNKSIFGTLFPLDYYINLCFDLYGD